jgi:hypothetical protein
MGLTRNPKAISVLSFYGRERLNVRDCHADWSVSG